MDEDRCAMHSEMSWESILLVKTTAVMGPNVKMGCVGQAEQPIVDVFSDSDWAGCAKTRRWTSSSYVMLGGHLVAASATTQNVVATSAGEAEFYALTKSASSSVDATASKAIASGRGVGRVRHLQT